MASYSDVTLAVLNQIDRIPYEQRARTLEDVQRILAAEGLPDVKVVGVSATRGDGIDDLERELASRIRAKQSAKGRLGSDINAAAQVMATVGGTSQVPGISSVDRQHLDDALVACAGVPQVVDAIAASTRRQAILRTGWPVARWLGKLRRDPLKDLGLGSDMSMTALAKASLPEASPVQRANAELAIRDLTEKASAGLEGPWRDAIRNAADPRAHTIVDDLDHAIEATHVRARTAWWWRAVHLVQWLAFLGLIAGLGWLAVEAVVDSYFPDTSLPDIKDIAGYPAGAVVAAGSAALGIILGLSSRLLARLSGRRRATKADQALRAAIDEVTVRRVIGPVQEQLDAYGAYRTGILAALD